MMRAGDFFATDLIISIKKVKLHPNAEGFLLRFDYNGSGDSKNPKPSDSYEPNVIRLYTEDLKELKKRLRDIENANRK